ncbi:MAG: hypothetical protein WCD44_04475 [Candidatus Babeliales bacterium]
MNTKPEFFVYFDKKFTGIMLLLLFPFLCITAFNFLLVPLSSFKELNLPYLSYFFIFFQIIIWCIIVLFILGWFYLLMQMLSKKPMAILKKEGVWINRHGFISWQHIETIFSYVSNPDNIKNLPIRLQKKNTMIGIKIRKESISLINKQSSLSGKLVFFWSKFFGYYYAKFFDHHHHITLACTDIPAEEIVSFADRYLKK